MKYISIRLSECGLSSKELSYPDECDKTLLKHRKYET